ncbi:hypothetical protein [Sphingomonas fennica]|uniref:hypothetical protein n=1 Tax=Edaphosphingomonas fennica TaxID=114404 RepID=UPI001FE467C6|nr:hypothetical protein [Sphingomonas fennica]
MDNQEAQGFGERPLHRQAFNEAIGALERRKDRLVKRQAELETIGLFIFIGLKQMHIGGQIVDYAFTAIVAGAAIAFALAVGLGGREVAARKLNELIK